MLISSHIARRIVGEQEVLMPAKKLIGLPGVDYAEGAPTESLMTGPMARQAIGSDGVAEINALFPDLILSASYPARSIPRGQQARALVARHKKNNQPLLQL